LPTRRRRDAGIHQTTPSCTKVDDRNAGYACARRITASGNDKEEEW
jgi:hypothetical protein